MRMRGERYYSKDPFPTPFFCIAFILRVDTLVNSCPIGAEAAAGAEEDASRECRGTLVSTSCVPSSTRSAGLAALLLIATHWLASKAQAAAFVCEAAATCGAGDAVGDVAEARDGCARCADTPVWLSSAPSAALSSVAIGSAGLAVSLLLATDEPAPKALARVLVSAAAAVVAGDAVGDVRDGCASRASAPKTDRNAARAGDLGGACANTATCANISQSQHFSPNYTSAVSG